MTEHPILFSAPMVRAILEGRKTMTRRELKPQPWLTDAGPFLCFQQKGEKAGKAWLWPNAKDQVFAELKYQVGDRLWVREGFAIQGFLQLPLSDRQPLEYLADIPDRQQIEDYTGKPSIHMPRWASRITLEVTAVKIERLQDISEDDAKAEGIHLWPAPREFGTSRRFAADYNNGPYGNDYRHAFSLLWERINGPGSLEANPWVAAYSFKRIEQ